MHRSTLRGERDVRALEVHHDRAADIRERNVAQRADRADDSEVQRWVSLDLKKMAMENVVECTLDELFPALRWYKEIENTEGKKPTKITLLVFCNGNIVVLGSKSRYQLLYMQEEINKTMPKYRCSHEDMIRYQETKKSKTKSSKRARASASTGGQKAQKRPEMTIAKPCRK